MESELSRLLALKDKKIKVSNMVIVVLVMIIIALIVFGWFYFRGRSPIDLSLSDPASNYRYLFSIYEPQNLQRPLGVTTASNGEVYVTDSVNHSVAVFDPRGKFKRKFGGLGANQGQFNYPISVIVSGSKVYVADFYNERVQVLTENGESLSIIPAAKDREKIGGSIMPVALAMDHSGNLYVSDVNQQKIFIFDANGNYVKSFGSAGSKPGELSYVNGITIDDDEDGLVYLADSNNSRISVFTKEGKFIRVLEKPGSVSNPKGITFDSDSHRVYVADTLSHVVKGIENTGEMFESVGSRGLDNGQFNFPTGVWIDGRSRLYVADRENNRVQVFDR